MDNGKKNNAQKTEWWKETPIKVKPTGDMKIKKVLKIVLICAVVLILLFLLISIGRLIYCVVVLAQDPDLGLTLKILTSPIWLPVWLLFNMVKYIVIPFFAALFGL